MDYVRVPKNNTPKPGLNVGLIMGHKETKGEVGLEIEVEGVNLLHDGEAPTYWQYHQDGSLRGAENAEYVLTKPLPFDKVPLALKSLWTAFKKKKSVISDSNRTSVHVHLNVQDFHLNRLTAFLAMYFALEEPLTEWCGETRVGNLFCLRAIDAPAIVAWTKRFIRMDGQGTIPDTLHYAALNVNALKKFGSIEIRTLRGVSDPVIIHQWVGILQRMYELSADFKDPREVCTMVSSGGGALAFFETVLGEYASVVRQGIGMNDEQLRNSIYNGIRLAQDICYCRDWSLYKPMPLKRDPFDRNMKKVAQKIMAGPAFPSDVYGVSAAPTPVPTSIPAFLVEDQDPWHSEPDYDDYPQEESEGF